MPELQAVRASSDAGRLLEQTLELDFDTQRFKVDRDSVDAEENMALKILDQERKKWEVEMGRRRQEEVEQEQRVRDAQARAGVRR